MRLTNLAIIGILLVPAILSGCSPNQETNDKTRLDFTEGQRNEMMQEILEIAKKSCEEK